MTETSRIVAICLVRNEEKFLGVVLANILEFCDHIFIADNCSTDRTGEIARQWAIDHKKVTVKSIAHPKESHEIVQPFVNTSTWVFAVDGDEIYDPAGLARLRTGLLEGTYDNYWRIIGNVFNCVELDIDGKLAKGYLSPPSRSITKLYNFHAIEDWSGVTGERLHGGEIVFKKGYRETVCLRLHEELDWEKSFFRCLHLCFIARSSKDSKPKNGVTTRWNLAEQQSRGVLVLLLARVFRRLGISLTSQWKLERYGRGRLVTKNIAGFFRGLDDGCS